MVRRMTQTDGFYVGVIGYFVIAASIRYLTFFRVCDIIILASIAK